MMKFSKILLLFFPTVDPFFSRLSLKMRFRLLASSRRGCATSTLELTGSLIPFLTFSTCHIALVTNSKTPQGLPCGCSATPWFWNLFGYRLSHGPQAVPKSMALPCPCLDCLTLSLLFWSGLGRRGIGRSLGFRLGFDLGLWLHFGAGSSFRFREWDSFRANFHVHGLLGPQEEPTSNGNDGRWGMFTSHSSKLNIC